MLMDEESLRKRINSVYSNMRARAKPKYVKTGKRVGKLRKEGMDKLPFKARDLWEYAVDAIGPAGVTRCTYCEDIGRPATLIDLVNCVFDHHHPLNRGGSWDLTNIRICCEDCNRCKGNLTYAFFITIMSNAEKWNDAKDRASFHACLRTHGVSMRLRGFGTKKELSAPTSKAEPANRLFPPDDDF